MPFTNEQLTDAHNQTWGEDWTEFQDIPQDVVTWDDLISFLDSAHIEWEKQNPECEQCRHRHPQDEMHYDSWREEYLCDTCVRWCSICGEVTTNRCVDCERTVCLGCLSQDGELCEGCYENYTEECTLCGEIFDTRELHVCGTTLDDH